jgi:hypothetical protein
MKNMLFRAVCVFHGKKSSFRSLQKHDILNAKHTNVTKLDMNNIKKLNKFRIYSRFIRVFRVKK